jgi:uncharacterized membrane protein YgdD (TMEM256/DUF423 family)
MRVSWTFRAAAILGLLGVALGAFGAHALKAALNSFGTADIWATAVFYQLVHAVALLALSGMDRVSRALAILWIGGIVLFSGSLYILALSDHLRILGPVTPIGGAMLIVGWLLLAIRGR